MNKQASMTIGLYVKYKNEDSSMSIYRDGKFIAALEDTTASCDLVYKMGVEILELEEKLKEAIKALEFYADGTNYEAFESQSHVVWEVKEEYSGEKAYEVLELIKGLK